VHLLTEIEKTDFFETVCPHHHGLFVQLNTAETRAR
jgi:hypothetical protein